MFLSSSRDKFELLLQNSSKDVSVGFPAAMLVPLRMGTNLLSIQISINLGKKYLA